MKNKEIKTYYAATIKDMLQLGRLYEHKVGGLVGSWFQGQISIETFNVSTGLTMLQEVMFNLNRQNSTGNIHYRIKHLDSEDIEALGFIKLKEDQLIFNDENTFEFYHYELKLHLHYYPISKGVIISDFHRGNLDSSDVLFKGNVLDIQEFMQVLRMVSRFDGEGRLAKFKPIKTITEIK